MAILEATGAQNDVVVALWLLAFLLYAWRALSDHSFESAVLCGLALGLALLTKGTAHLYAPGMGAALLAAWLLRRGHEKPRLPPLRLWFAALLLAACVNLGPWLRNMSVHGKPMCCGESYFVDRLTPAGAYSNVVRNAALHMGVPKLLGVVTRAVDLLTPAPYDDPATGRDERKFELSFSYHEGKAGNVLLFLAAAASAAAVAFHRPLRTGPATPWIAAAVAGFVTFSVALNWQPWGSRLHTPVFLAASVPVAILLGTRGRRMRASVLALFFVGSLPYLLRNESRPLLPLHKPSILTRDRINQYFVDQPALRAPYREAAQIVRASGEPEVGLLFDESGYEYPFWVMVKEDFAGPPILRHVGVTRAPFSDVPLAPPPPRLVVATRRAERRIVDGFEYVRVRDLGEVSILRRGGRAEPDRNQPAQ
jgi:4-amino-4-deoxy-L-arabinose transferase-like glycosyltransferase